jgi:Fe2+ or Zn2+ uptake regulation protein
VTVTKRAIVEALYATPDGVTADALDAVLGDTDVTTVYRTLGQLEQVGVVEHVHLGHGPAVFRLLTGSTVTVLCDACGRVTHIPLAEFAPTVAAIGERHGVHLDLHHFALSGRCADGDCVAAAATEGAAASTAHR